MKKTVYQRIIRAANRGHGLRISASEAATLASQADIYTIAEIDDKRAKGSDMCAQCYGTGLAMCQTCKHCEGTGWTKVLNAI